MSDDQQGKEVSQGSIPHKDFEDFKVDVTGSIKNLKLLNTISKDNEHRYGASIVSGSLTVSGSIDNLAVCLQAKTDTGTNIFIPMYGASNTMSKYDVIQFVDFEPQDKVKQTK